MANRGGRRAGAAAGEGRILPSPGRRTQALRGPGDAGHRLASDPPGVSRCATPRAVARGPCDALDVGVVGVAQDQVAQRIDQEDRRGRRRAAAPRRRPASARRPGRDAARGCRPRASRPRGPARRARSGPAPCPASCAPAASRRACARRRVAAPRATDEQHPAAAQVGEAKRRAVRQRSFDRGRRRGRQQRPVVHPGVARKQVVGRVRREHRRDADRGNQQQRALAAPVGARSANRAAAAVQSSRRRADSRRLSTSHRTIASAANAYHCIM